MAVKTVGRFSYDDEAGTVSGPAEYMREKGNARLADIEAGRDVVFNMTASYSPDIVTAILVNLQTDFAGWVGMRQFIRVHRL